MGSFPVWLVHFRAFSLAIFGPVGISGFPLFSISYDSFYSELFLLGLFHTLLLPSSSSCGIDRFSVFWCSSLLSVLFGP